MVIVGKAFRFLEVGFVLCVHGFYDIADDLASHNGMELHFLEFFLGEPAWLVQDGIGDMDLANVVERGGVEHIKHEFIGEFILVQSLFLHLAHDDPGICGCIADMIPGALVAAFHDIRKDHDQGVLQVGDFFAFLGCLDERFV